jgi:hypothetical protein
MMCVLQRLRFDDLDIAGGVKCASHAGYDDDRHHDDKHRGHDNDPVLLGAGESSGSDGGSANGPSRQKEEEIERHPADEEQRYGDACDHECPDGPVPQRLRRLVRPDRRGHVLRPVVGGGLMCLDSWDCFSP